MVTHVHGAVGVGDESDGDPEAWFLPAARNLPSDHARHGTWYEFFAGKAQDRFGVTWGDGFATAQYPNDNRASTIWYHDHSLGLTRQNVYAGPAGFFLLRGGPGGDGAVRDTRTNEPAVLPGPAPKYGATRTSHCRTSRWLSRTGRSTPTDRCSTPTPGRSSTTTPDPTFRTRRPRRCGTPSSSATPSSSTDAPGPTCRCSARATDSGC